MDGVRASAETPPLTSVVAFAWRTRSLRWLALGAAVATLGGAALFHFGPSHVARVSSLSRAEIGAGMGLAAVAGGLVGTSLAGLLTDWLAKRDSRAYFATSALGSLGTIPFILAFLYADEPRLGFVWLAASVFFSSMYLGPVAALPQTLSPARMRATIVVVLALVNTGFGQGLGALFVGAVSDALRAAYAEASLQHALAWVTSVAYAASLIFYALGARHVRADLADAGLRAAG
jgi:preprotein translocase subunit SecG